MAEAVLSFGIAANVIQFVDFGCKLFSTGYVLYKSRKGLTDRHQNLEDITDDLHKISKNLQSSLHETQVKQKLSVDELQLQQLAEKCANACTVLLTALETLKSQGEISKWKSFRTALKTTWSKDKISDLQRSLDDFRQEIVVRILSSLR